MSDEADTRHLDGVSQDLRAVAANLRLSADDESPRKAGALLALRDLVSIVIRQTGSGDFDCSRFLAELAAYLGKTKNVLEHKSSAFAKTLGTLQSARLTTKRSSPLRPIIQAIVADACRKKFSQEIAKEILEEQVQERVKGNWQNLDWDEVLLSLPDFGDDPSIVQQWTDKLVYPALVKMEAELKTDPVIGELEKAKDVNGKFHLANLKPLILKTVARIAALPKTRYFRLE